MRKLIFILAMLFLASSLAVAQDAVKIPAGSALPTLCTPGNVRTALFYKTGSVSPGLYQCTATNTWTLVGSGGGGGISDGDKGDLTVSGSGTTWRLNVPVNLGDAAYTSWFPTTTPAVSDRRLYAGFSPRRTITDANGFVGSEFGYPISMNGQASKLFINNLLAMDVQGASSNSTVYGQFIDLFSNSAAPTGTSTYAGIATNVDVGAPWTNSYGGYFSAYVGSSAAAGAVNITGVFGGAGGAYQTGITNAYAGDFEISSSSGGAVTTSLAVGVRSRLRLNLGTTFTDYRGVSISDWTTPSGGTIDNAYGLYIDNSMAGATFGTVNKYAIRSLATADSLFDGPVRGPINAYDATAWNGSNKFATEDAIRDLIVSGGSAVTGSGTNTKAAFFTGATQIGEAPLEYAANKFTAYHTTNTDEFKLEMTGAVTGVGDFKVGSSSTVENYIRVATISAVPTVRLASRRVQMGDAEGFGNGTLITLDDSSNGITLGGSASALTVTANNVYNWQYNRTLTTGGVTGAQTINKPYGSVNFAAGASSLVVTNSVAVSSSIIFPTPQTNDATCRDFSITRASGSFTINANAPCTAETTVGFQVTN
jgi:hypothetical protein